MDATIDNGKLIICLEGRIGADNAATWETANRELIGQHPEEDLVFDAEKLTYITSAGLRMLLALSKEKGVKLSVINVDLEVYAAVFPQSHGHAAKGVARKRVLAVED